MTNDQREIPRKKRIVWYLHRYHGIRTSDATEYRVCKRHGLNRIPNRVGRRAVHTHPHEKEVPGDHVQVDVKFLTLKQQKGTTLSVHGDRQRHTSASTRDLPPPHSIQRHRLHQLRGGQAP